jgi:hypothetical protein
LRIRIRSSSPKWVASANARHAFSFYENCTSSTVNQRRRVSMSEYIS